MIVMVDIKPWHMIYNMIDIKPDQSKNTLIKLNHTWKTSQIILKNLTEGKFN